MARHLKMGGNTGPAFGGDKLEETNGNREPGKFHKLDDEAKVSKLGTKTSSDGFKRGGKTKRAAGGKVRGKAAGGGIDADGSAREPAHEEDSGMKKGGAAKRKDGGAIAGSASSPSLAKRARGGRTSAPFSNVHVPKDRQGSSSSGHEGE